MSRPLPRLKSILSELSINGYTERSEMESQATFLSHRSAFFALLSVTIVIAFSYQWTVFTIADGSVYDNSRWGRMPAAYEAISSQDSQSVIFIGSSRFYSGIDGGCLGNDADSSENTDSEVQFWNLAIRGDVPYLRLPETELIANSGASVVVIEAGPNSFSSGIGTVEHRLRWQVFSINSQISTDEPWYDQIREDDRKYIISDDVGRYSFIHDSLGGSTEEFAYRLVNGGDSSFLSDDGRLPNPESPDWLASLKSPPIDDKVEMSNSDFNEYVEVLVNGGLWKPDDSRHHNRLALEHMSERLHASGIEVVFFSPPVHPDFLEAIPSGHWDAYNSSIAEFSDNFLSIDWTWEIWDDEDFTDPHHFSPTGRSRLCSELAPEIASILSG